MFLLVYRQLVTCHQIPNIFLPEEDSEEAVGEEDGENVPVELSALVVTEGVEMISPTGYRTVGDEIV